MSKLEKQMALPRRRPFREIVPGLLGVVAPKTKPRKAKKAKRKP